MQVDSSGVKHCNLLLDALEILQMPQQTTALKKKKKIQNRISKPLSKHWSWDSTLNWIMFITHKSCLKLIFSDKTIALVCGRCLTMHPFFFDNWLFFNLLLWYGDLECPKKMPINNIYHHHYYQYYLPRGPLICAADSTRTLTQRQHSTQKHNNWRQSWTSRTSR